MKHLSLIAIVAAAVLVASCDKTPINGALDGMWQLTTITTPDGVREMTGSRLFVSFQLHLTQWERSGTGVFYHSHFTHEGDSIRFYDFCYRARHDLSDGDNDLWITPAGMDTTLGQWGIHSTDARYHVRELSHSSLVLEAADTTLAFRKF